MLQNLSTCDIVYIDGLSHAYKITKDTRIKELLDEMISVYLGIDKVSLQVQTHCTLTAARAMVRMYQETGDKRYLSGAQDTLHMGMYEAFFCCTMRLAEGLWYINSNRELFSAQTEGKVKKHGRIYADGDILYAQVSGGAESYAENQVEVDGLILSPLIKYYKLPKEMIETTKQKILF